MENFSFIIPTKNRPIFLERLLKYYSDREFQGILVIGDSSTGDNLIKNRKLIGALRKKLRINYSEYPNIKQAATCYELNKLVETPYVSLLNDDDLIVPNAVKKCVEFLEKNDDYSAAHGLGLSIKTPNSYPYGKLTKCVKKTIPISEDGRAADRFLNNIIEFSDVHHSVHRKEGFDLMFSNPYRLANNSDNSDHPFLMWFAQMHTFVSGKVKELDVLYIIRHIQDRPITSTYKEANKLHDWISGLLWNQNLKTYHDSIIKTLMMADGLSYDQAETIFNQGFFSYLSLWFFQTCNNDNSNTNRSIRSKTLSFIFPNIPSKWIIKFFNPFSHFLLKIISTIRDKQCNVTRAEPLNDNLLNRNTNTLLPSLLHEGSRYHNDFMPVYNMITNSSEFQ